MSVPIRVQMDFIDFNYSPSSNWNTRFTPFTPGYSPSLILSFFLFYCSKMWHVERQLCLVDNLVVAQLCLMLYDRVRVGWAKYRWPSTQTSNGISKKCDLNGSKKLWLLPRPKMSQKFRWIFNFSGILNQSNRLTCRSNLSFRKKNDDFVPLTKY